LTFKQVLLDGEYDFPLEHSPKVIVDAGAHVGLTSIWFATRYPKATIIAIEPERANYKLMVRNLAAFPNVTPVEAALWSHRGVVAIDDPGAGTWGFQTAELNGKATSGATVESLTVEDIMERFHLDRIDLLKVDIEGAEKEVFSDPGAVKWTDAVDAIEVELHDRFQPGCSRAFFSRVGDFKIEYTRGMNTFVARGN
jgi:FkbM family methyltransferase